MESQAYMDSVAVVQAQAAGVDYLPTIECAKHGDASALSSLLRLSLAMDGVGADIHSSQLWDLLQRWGDSAFAMRLREESRQVQARVICYITMSACDPRTPGWYPLTYAAVPKSQRCECSD
jgi:hypothetical protein